VSTVNSFPGINEAVRGALQELGSASSATVALRLLRTGFFLPHQLLRRYDSRVRGNHRYFGVKRPRESSIENRILASAVHVCVQQLCTTARRGLLIKKKDENGVALYALPKPKNACRSVRRKYPGAVCRAEGGRWVLVVPTKKGVKHFRSTSPNLCWDKAAVLLDSNGKV